ncbi:MAG: GGDEF domain-containing protein [Zetaproteobacteria bacterium CG12_big_fil_rev_8_21_14_0_65_55_1124]|nr:MAG: GGDEF domain-containing protein [Zetaproteobacteria bacterium CG08_land_8_20_14_0_20_55_17]PIW42028.1 MAG: GGDEF domain-containing protein [Zetaproteobacteria bacterium CG12_big_fil_rev_8_21_14_0_65_55_1124]PIY53934.1 MAG: GGDEF domain-containing protein [Zetaproteobacteria bacterium CG_4_10_14_0_8_um_filter_55_43]PIZ39379.1 MAG: GGDEF domain-containing protein [Zetaproteobacteria bacterium CG_4_10_14_0_2_um_filter_55_20]PJB80735.1 MAG: GGDEF domain-containing protein [Zetaproteobacteri
MKNVVKHLQEHPQRVLILGAGEGGTDVLEMLHDETLANVVGVVDSRSDSKGLMLARELQTPVFSDIDSAIEACKPCLVFNLTGNEEIDRAMAETPGVDGVIGGLQAKLIVRMVNRIKESRDQMRYEATHDALTCIYNRRHIQTLLGEAVAQASRYNLPFSIALLDLDHFKSINDTYGHPAGDAVLKGVVQSLQACIRDADIIGRWGGEEFILLLPHTDNAAAVLAAEHWLAHVCQTPIRLPDGQDIQVSFSAGVASYKGRGDKQAVSECIEALLHEVDVHLYDAKAQGRKRVCGSECR